MGKGTAAITNGLPLLRDSDTGVREKPRADVSASMAPWLDGPPAWHAGVPHHWSDDMPEIFRATFERNCLNSGCVRKLRTAVNEHGDRKEDVRLVYDFFTLMRSAFTPFGRDEIRDCMKDMQEQIWPLREMFGSAPLSAFKPLGEYLTGKTRPVPLLSPAAFSDYMGSLSMRQGTEPISAFSSLLVLMSHRYSYSEGALGQEVVDCIVDAVDETGWSPAALRLLWRFLDYNHMTFDQAAIARLGGFFVVQRRMEALRTQKVTPFGGSLQGGEGAVGEGDAGIVPGAASVPGAGAQDAAAAAVAGSAGQAAGTASASAFQVFLAKAGSLLR